MIHGRTLQCWFTSRYPQTQYLRFVPRRVRDFIFLLCLIALPVTSVLIILISVAYTVTKDKHSKGGKTAYLVIVIVLAAAYAFFMILIMAESYLIGILNPLPGDIPRDMARKTAATTRLVVMDQGFIGTAPSDTMAGDKVYFIAGCTKPVVLRETWIGDRPQHRVLGACLLCPSPQPVRQIKVWRWKDLIGSLFCVFSRSGPWRHGKMTHGGSLLDMLSSGTYLEDASHINALMEYKRMGLLQKMELI